MATNTFAHPDMTQGEVWNQGDWSALYAPKSPAPPTMTVTTQSQPGALSSGAGTTTTNSGLLAPETGYTPTHATAKGYDGATYGAKTYETTKMNPADVAKANAAQASAAQAKASLAQAYTYDAYKQAVAKEDLTSYHLNKLLDENSDYIKRAKTEGLQQANARGLLNTSMAAGAAHGAAIDRAAPIASQDAGTYNERALTHIAEENTARRTNATNKTNVSMSNASNETNVSMDNARNATNVSVANANNQTATSQFNAGQENSFWKQYIDNENAASQFNTGQENRASEFNATSTNTAGQFNALQENNIALANMGADNEAAVVAIEANTKIWDNERQRDHEIVTTKLAAEVNNGTIDREVGHNLQGMYVKDVGIITERYSKATTDILQNPAMWGAPDEKTGVTAGQAAINAINGYWVDESGKQYDTEQPGTRKVEGMREADMKITNALYEAQPMWNYNFSQADFPATGA